MDRPLLLVGDNPFLGISHVSQERARARAHLAGAAADPCAILLASVDAGADGFTFSVTDATEAILREAAMRGLLDRVALFPLIPYAQEWVRWSARDGIVGIGRRHLRQLLRFGSLAALRHGLAGLARGDFGGLLNSYVAVQLSRIRGVDDGARVAAVFLHEVLTDVAVALDLRELVTRYVDFVRGLGHAPGLETRNFSFLVRRLREWGVAARDLWLAAPFNRLGFQMAPDRGSCERALASLPARRVIAMSIFAGGYDAPAAGVEYVRTLPNLGGVAVGVSSVRQARETFHRLREAFAR